MRIIKKQENGFPRGNKIRPTLRLCRVGLATAKNITKGVAKRLFFKDPKFHGIYTIHNWSKDIVSSIGINIKCLGNIPDQGALLVSNHRSYIDIVVIGNQLPITFLAKEEISRWPLIGYGCKITDVVFVERDNIRSRKDSREHIFNLLNQGISIAVFPEGTSFEGPGILPFRSGVFQLAAENNFPVIPVAIELEDPRDAWVGDDTFGRHFFQSFSKKETNVTIAFGDVYRSNNADTLKDATWQWIQKTLVTLDSNKQSIQNIVKQKMISGEGK